MTTHSELHAKRPRLDTACAQAIELARDAAVEYGGADRVGEHIIALAEGERVVEHRFTAHEPGYKGWEWSVTVMRASRSKNVTVAEIALLPAEGALLAPEWLPWAERLQPGDLGTGDLLPAPPHDERLASAFLLSDDPAVAETAYELGMGRARVMSRKGREDLASRWYSSECGPDSDAARGAPGPCGTCAFYLPLAGSLGGAFGVCGNVYAPDDGKAVSADHGCGAHSEGGEAS